jgi:hypothetical protein
MFLLCVNYFNALFKLALASPTAVLIWAWPLVIESIIS